MNHYRVLHLNAVGHRFQEADVVAMFPMLSAYIDWLKLNDIIRFH
jgi:hypothetical protein